MLSLLFLFVEIDLTGNQHLSIKVLIRPLSTKEKSHIPYKNFPIRKKRVSITVAHQTCTSQKRSKDLYQVFCRPFSVLVGYLSPFNHLTLITNSINLFSERIGICEKKDHCLFLSFLAIRCLVSAGSIRYNKNIKFFPLIFLSNFQHTVSNKLFYFQGRHFYALTVHERVDKLLTFHALKVNSAFENFP